MWAACCAWAIVIAQAPEQVEAAAEFKAKRSTAARNEEGREKRISATSKKVRKASIPQIVPVFGTYFSGLYSLPRAQLLTSGAEQEVKREGCSRRI